MICARCLFRQSLPRHLRSTLIPSRNVQTLTSSRGPPSHGHDGPPAATSTSAAQPFSTPLSPAPEVPSAAQREKKSSVPAGVPLKALGYFKSKDPPVTMEDHEYPDWLWGLLDSQQEGDAKVVAGTDGDAYSKSKKERRIAARAAVKAAKANPASLLPKVPLQEQTIDLPTGDGSAQGAIEAGAARRDLTAAMRQDRRKSIKEANFLKGMR